MATTLEGIDDTFRRWGIPYDSHDVVPGRPQGLFVPEAVMLHHTAPGTKVGVEPSRRVVREGRPDLPGPLYQLVITRGLFVDIVTLGRANHAGTGGPWRGLSSGNRSFVGVAFEHMGTAAEPWPADLTAFGELVTAAVLDHLGRDSSWVQRHKDWTPRKPDPLGVTNINDFRHGVRTLLEQGPPNDQEDDMQPQDMLRAPVRLGPGAAEVLGQEKDLKITVEESLAIGPAAAREAAITARRVETLATRTVDELRELRASIDALTAAVKAQNGPDRG